MERTQKEIVSKIVSLLNDENYSYDKLHKEIQIKRNLEMTIPEIELVTIAESSGKIKAYKEILWQLGIDHKTI